LAPDKQIALISFVIEIPLALAVGGERVVFRIALLLGLIPARRIWTLAPNCSLRESRMWLR